MKVGVDVSGPRLAVRDTSERLARRYIGLSAAAFLAVFGLFWIYTATSPMAFLSRDYPSWIAKKAMLASCNLGAVSFFGDSRAMAAIDPRALPFPSSNFALSGSSPIEAYFAAKRLLQCKTTPKTVVIAYSVGKYMEDSDYWNISARAGVLSFANMQTVARESHLLDDDEIQRLSNSDHLPLFIREALYAAHFPSFYFGSLIDGYGFGRYAHNREEERAISLSRGHALFGTEQGSDAIATEAVLPRFSASPLIDAYFRTMLAAFAHRHIGVVLLSVPINDATCRVMNPSIRPEFQAYLRHVVATVPDARLLGPTMPCWADSLFGDAFHLNATGAAVYSKLVARWLQPAMPQTASAARIVER